MGVSAVRGHNRDSVLADSFRIFLIFTQQASSWLSHFRHYILTFHRGRLSCCFVIWVGSVVTVYHIDYVKPFTADSGAVP